MHLLDVAFSGESLDAFVAHRRAVGRTHGQDVKSKRAEDYLDIPLGDRPVTENEKFAPVSVADGVRKPGQNTQLGGEYTDVFGQVGLMVVVGKQCEGANQAISSFIETYFQSAGNQWCIREQGLHSMLLFDGRVLSQPLLL